MILAPIYLTSRFFWTLSVAVLIFVASYSIPSLYIIGQMLLALLVILAIVEAWWLFRLRGQVGCDRQIAEKLSLGDLQQIGYQIWNQSQQSLLVEMLDELPYQLQMRDFIWKDKVTPEGAKSHEFNISPLLRGAYKFGNINLYCSIPWMQLVAYRVVLKKTQMVRVMPSIIQMNKYEIEVFSQTASLSGIRRVRQLGENDEFEHIRLYQQGDNVKSINWKATSRRSALMVNRFQNTRSQEIYCVIDKGRSMRMPFDGLSLLDYAVNTALVISNIVLRKFDRIGLVTFSNRIGSLVSAQNTKGQLSILLEKLYDQRTEFKESNFELLYHALQHQVRRRSILLFFTNFEHLQDVERNINYLRAINRHHLLVIIFFENTALHDVQDAQVESLTDIYVKTFAEKAIMEKQQIRDHLTLHGIQCILTQPHRLSTDVINKYLEIKARRQM
ncbi:MAG: DUF58 domain-containing protein [Saprospiraceae bacterium]|nr:DUF58 domain-containing protein [Saprospiraceae bacterium]